MSTVQPERLALLDYLNRLANVQLVIPAYQRNYIWTVKKQISKLISDYKNLLNDNVKKHFIGIIMYLQIPRGIGFTEYSIVDGQQRLVTIFLLLYALRDIAHEQGATLKEDQINNLYLINRYVEDENNKLKLKPLVTDDTVLEKIINRDFKNIDKKSNVYLNYKNIKEHLQQLCNNHSIDELLNVLNKFYFVAIPLDSQEDNAQKIFETINSAGAALSKSDLIRNYILMNIPNMEQEKLYNKYWLPLEKKFKDLGKLESFFRMFLANKTYNLVNLEDIYEAFQKWYDNEKKNKSNEDILKEIIKYSNYYYDLSVEITSELDKRVTSALEEYKKCTIEPATPLLMEVYDLYEKLDDSGNRLLSQESFINIIKLFNTYSIRRNICNQRTGILTRIIPSMLKTLLERCNGNYEHIYENCVNLLVDANKNKQSFMPDDEYLRKNLINANAYALKTYFKTVFEKIELHNNPAPVSFDNLSIEHLMPQTPTDEWLENLNVKKEEYEFNLHRLGNLTLASKSDNSKMSNNLFDYKQEILKSTNHLNINLELYNLDKWDIENIEKRTNELINKICELYPYISFGIENNQSYTIKAGTNKLKVNGKLYLDKTVEILSDSTFKVPLTSEISSLIDSEILEEQGENYKFKKDLIFSSLEEATNLIFPYIDIDPYEFWVDNNGEPLNVEVKTKIYNANLQKK